MKFDYNQFAKSIDTYAGMDVSDENNGKYGWVQWDSNSSNAYNQVLEYKYTDSHDTYNFRSWHQETSVMKNNGGMIVSVKIDYERETGDDHIILITGYDLHGKLNVAQVSIQFHGDSGDDLTIAPIKASQTSDIPTAIYNAIATKQNGVDYGGDTDNHGRKSFPIITKNNILAMMAAVSVS
jgi:hypothetical protein